MLQAVVIQLGQRPRLLLMHYTCKCQKWLPLPCLDAASSLSYFCVSQPSPCTSVELHHEVGLKHSLVQAGACAWVVVGNWSASCSVSSHPLHPALGASKHTHAPHEQSSGFPQPSYYSHWPSNQTRRLDFPVSNPRVAVSNIWLKLLTPQETSLPTLHM